jgi:hypothetical protein
LDVAGHFDLGVRHLSGVLLDVVQAPLVDFRKLRSFFLELEVEEGVFAREVEGVLVVVGGVLGRHGRQIVPQLRGVLVAVTVFSHC